MRWPWSPKADPRWRPEFENLARYNGEVARGILHSEEWRAEMAALQREYDEAYHPDWPERMLP